MAAGNSTTTGAEPRTTRRAVVTGAATAGLGALGVSVPASATQVASPDPPTDGLPLDESAELVGLIRDWDGGTIYAAFRRENALWYADRIELFAGDEQVTSEQEAEEVLQAIAWHERVSTVKDSHLQSMRRTVETAARIQTVTSAVAGLFDEIVAFIDWMQDTSVAGVSVWDAATSADPTLETLEDAIRETYQYLTDWARAADAVASWLPDAVQFLESAGGSSAFQGDPDAVTGTVGDAVEGLEAVRSAVDGLEDLEPLTRDLAGEFSDIGATSHQIASNVTEVPVYGNDIASHFQDFGNGMNSHASDVSGFADTLEGQADLLEDVLDEVTSTHEELSDLWGRSQDAETRVYGTLGGAGVAGLSGVGLAAWKLLL